MPAAINLPAIDPQPAVLVGAIAASPDLRRKSHLTTEREVALPKNRRPTGGASLDQPDSVGLGGGGFGNLKDADGAWTHDVLTSGRAPGFKTLAV